VAISSRLNVAIYKKCKTDTSQVTDLSQNPLIVPVTERVNEDDQRQTYQSKDDTLKSRSKAFFSARWQRIQIAVGDRTNNKKTSENCVNKIIRRKLACSTTNSTKYSTGAI